MNLLLIFSVLVLLLALSISLVHLITLRKKIIELNQQNNALYAQHEKLQSAEAEIKKEIDDYLNRIALLCHREETSHITNENLERIVTERTEEVKNLQTLISTKEELLQTVEKKIESIVAQHVIELQQRDEELENEKLLRIAQNNALIEYEKQVQGIIEKLPLPTCIVNTNGIIEVANNAFHDLVADFNDDIVHQHFSVVIPEEKKENALRAWNAFLTHAKDVLFETELAMHNGARKVVSIEMINTTNARGERRIIAVVLDISKQRKAEEDIQQALEHEKDLRALKSNFVSMVSHELRTPLTTILSNTELLERFSAKWDGEKRDRALHRILDSVHRMMDLLNDVLFIGKINAGKVDFKPTSLDLSLLCQNINDEIFNAGTGKQHRLQFAIQGNTSDIPADPKLLQNAIGNVLNNAVKYSTAGSVVTCMAKCTETEAVITVRDEGIGIMPEDRKKLFSVFHRGSNVGTIQGTGLGLAIVKYCIDMHNGTVDVESEVGKGTTVTITLPLKLSNAQTQ